MDWWRMVGNCQKCCGMVVNGGNGEILEISMDWWDWEWLKMVQNGGQKCWGIIGNGMIGWEMVGNDGEC